MLDNAIRTLGLAIFVAGFLLLLGTIGWQTIHFLREGFWMPVSIFDMAYAVSVEFGDQIYPNNWIGLAKILDWFNGGVLLAFACFSAGTPMMSLE